MFVLILSYAIYRLMRPLSKVETRRCGLLPFFINCINTCLCCSYVFYAILRIETTGPSLWYIRIALPLPLLVCRH